MSSYGSRAIAVASMILLALVGAMLTSTATGSAAQPSVAQPTTMPPAQVSIVHGIPGQPLDVYVNGSKTLSNLQPGAVAGPLALPAGSYNLALTKPGQPVNAAILSVNNAPYQRVRTLAWSPISTQTASRCSPGLSTTPRLFPQERLGSSSVT